MRLSYDKMIDSCESRNFCSDAQVIILKIKIYWRNENG